MTTPTKERVKEAVERVIAKINHESPRREDLIVILCALQAETERLDWLEDVDNFNELAVNGSTDVSLRAAIDSLRNQGKAGQ